MAEARKLEDSVEEFGQFVIQSLTAMSARLTQGVDVEALAEGADHLEFDVAIPFHVKLHVGSGTTEQKPPPALSVAPALEGPTAQ